MYFKTNCSRHAVNIIKQRLLESPILLNLAVDMNSCIGDVRRLSQIWVDMKLDSFQIHPDSNTNSFDVALFQTLQL